MADKKIKLLYMITGLKIGGAELFLLDLIKNINREKFDCSLLYLKGKADIADEFAKLKVTVFDNSKYFTLNPYKYVHIYRLIKKNKFDIIHSHLIHSNIISRIIGKAAGVKKIINSEHNTSNWQLKNFLLIIIYRLTLRFVNIIHCISNSVKNNLLTSFKIDKDRLVVIYDGIQISRFENCKSLPTSIFIPEDSYPILGCVSRMDRRKGIEYLIGAVEILRQKYINVILLLIGDGTERENLAHSVKDKNLCNNVKFVGKTFEVEKYLAMLDVFILPSLYEGLSIAVIEAMAAGVPVIASSTGGIPEVLEHNYNGILVKAGDSNEIAQAVIRLLSNEELKNKFVSNAKRVVSQKFDIKGIAQQFEKLYLNLYLTKE